MNLTGLHLLLTYECNFECDHCFVWGSPRQTGTMTLAQVRHILSEAQKLRTVEWFWLEGGEPFLYYPIMLRSALETAQMGFKVGLLSNSYWATQAQDAVEWLQPFAGVIDDLAISTDLYHYSEKVSQQSKHVRVAAAELGIPMGVIQVAEPEDSDAAATKGTLPPGQTRVMYRGRAAAKLADRAQRLAWTEYTQCPYEDLREPGRLHVDPFGHLHICQGITVGNLFDTPLRSICETYDPEAHPITGALLEGGPVELVRRYSLPHRDHYADACHLCDSARRLLRDVFPKQLGPDQMYGVVES